MQELRRALRTGLVAAGRSLTHARLYAFGTACVLGVGLGVVLMVGIMRDRLTQHPFALGARADVVVLSEVDSRQPQRLGLASPASFLEWRESLGTMVAMLTAIRTTDVNVRVSDYGLRLQAAMVTDSVFALVGGRAASGRLFDGMDFDPRADATAVLSDYAWRARFNADTSLIGKVVSINGKPTRLIGVVPDRFVVPAEAEVFLPMRLGAGADADRDSRFLLVMGQLRTPGSQEALRRRIVSLASENERRFARSNAGWSAQVSSIADYFAGRLSAFMTILLGVVGALAALVLVNASAAMLARNSQQAHALAIRAALGASSASLAIFRIAEGTILGALGGIAAIPVAFLGLRWWRGALPPYLAHAVPGWGGLRLGGTEVVFTVLAGTMVGALCAVWPALAAGGSNLTGAVAGARGAASRQHARWRRMLVAAEVALAFVLVASGGLLIAGVSSTLHSDLGFGANVAWTTVVAAPIQGDSNAARGMARALGAVRERLRGDPGVAAVGAASELPLSWTTNTIYYSTEAEALDPAHAPSAVTHGITPGYIDAIGIRLLEGRDINAFDSASAPAIMLVNATLATSAFGTTRVTGRRLLVGGQPRVIAGVVSDTRHIPMSQRPSPELYIPVDQTYRPSAVLRFALRFTDGGARSAESVRQLVQRAADEVAPGLAVDDTRTLTTVIDEAIAPERALAMMLSSFGLLALLVAVLGVYAVTAYLINLRMPEFAMRSALGASPKALATLVLTDTMRMVSWGLVSGALLSVGIARLLASQIPELPVGSVLLWASIAFGLVGAVLLATMSPMWRASRTPPWLALRNG